MGGVLIECIFTNIVAFYQTIAMDGDIIWYVILFSVIFCHCMTYLYIFNLILWELEGSIETESRSSKGKNAIHTL